MLSKDAGAAVLADRLPQLRQAAHRFRFVASEEVTPQQIVATTRVLQGRGPIHSSLSFSPSVKEILSQEKAELNYYKILTLRH